MKLAIGCDHGGFERKETVVAFLREQGYEVTDFGCESGETADYPDVAEKVCRAVLEQQCDLAVLLCGTGIGISIAANKIHGIRAALCGDCFSARMAKEHNNANVLVLGGRVLGPELANEIVHSFLKATFQGGRHQKRLDKIQALES